MTGMIRPARPGDLDEICRIEEASFSVPWKRSDYEALIGLEDAVFLVICGGGGATDEAVLGYGCIRHFVRTDCCAFRSDKCISSERCHYWYLVENGLGPN